MSHRQKVPSAIKGKLVNMLWLMGACVGSCSLASLVEMLSIFSTYNQVNLTNTEIVRFASELLGRYQGNLTEILGSSLEGQWNSNHPSTVAAFFLTHLLISSLFALSYLCALSLLSLLDRQGRGKTLNAQDPFKRLRDIAYFAPWLWVVNALVRQLLTLRLSGLEMALSITVICLAAIARKYVKVGLNTLQVQQSMTGLAALLISGALITSLVKPSTIRANAPGRERPNILLVSIDSLRADHLHSYGYQRETSPNIDALAAEGALFKTVVAPAPWTLPSHQTLMTALTPEQHGVTDQDVTLNEHVLTLAEVLQSQGYATSAFVGGAFLAQSYGFGQGFDHYDDYTVVRRGDERAFNSVTSPPLISITKTWLNSWLTTETDRPFFVFLHLWDVHYDYMPPPPYDTLFDPDYTGQIDVSNYASNREIHKSMNEEDLEHVIALYDGEIRFTDHHLGQLVQYLKVLGQWDNTLIVVTADHGEEFFEHGRKGHTKALYDESLLVPLIMRYPTAVPRGLQIETQVRTMDIAPTILSLTGIKCPPEFGRNQGQVLSRDLSPEFRGKTLKMATAPSSLKSAASSLRTPKSKLIVGENRNKLFNLLRDPGEKSNLAPQKPQRVYTLKKALQDWQVMKPNLDAIPPPILIDPDLAAQLQQLGYMD